MSPRSKIVAAAVLFSTGGAAIKFCAFGAWQLAAFRATLAMTTILIVLPEARRGWSWRIVPGAAAFAATLITFVLANRLTTAANAIFLQSAAPLYLLLLSPLLLREPIRHNDVLYMVAVIAGMAACFAGAGEAVATAPDLRRGNILAVASMDRGTVRPVHAHLGRAEPAGRKNAKFRARTWVRPPARAVAVE